MNEQEQPKRRGRPPGARGAGVYDPPRMLGRVSDVDWIRLQEAAAIAGKTFSGWALEILRKAADREIKKPRA